MKKHNKKWITLMLAGLCAVTLSAGIASTAVQADETPAQKTAATYAISDIFSTTGTADGKSGTVAFTLGNGQYARIKRDLAFKWYEGKNDARYLTVKFAFKELNFTSMTFEVESASSIATEEGKAVNAVKFTVEDGKVFATVVNGKIESAKFETAIQANQDVTLALCEGSSFDSFGVTVNGDKVGEFTAIGANYADYDSSKTYPLEINATTSSDNKAIVLLKEINGQSFATNVEDEKITDTAAPVLVVNEELNGFQFGYLFSLSYEKIDVLQASSLTDEKKYYQYNPADTAIAHSATLTTATRFMDTVYYTADGTNAVKELPEGDAATAYKPTSVIAEEGREYVSIEITLGDSTFDNTKNEDGTIPYAKKTYDLSWYASSSALVSKTLGEDSAEFIVIDDNDEGAQYTHIVANDETKKNEYINQDAFNAQVAAYQKQINEKITAEKPLAGSNAKFKLPSALDWLIKDNFGYRTLKFTICYRTPSSSAGKTAPNLDFDELEIPTAEEGLYEFKVFANDAGDNTMKYYLDGKLVDVAASNIWNIEEIPSFTFEIENKGIEVEEVGSVTSKRKSEKKLNDTFTLSSMTVLGATNQASAYTLYRFDESKADITVDEEDFEKALVSVAFKTIKTEALKLLNEVGEGKTYATHFELYLDIYVGAIAAELNVEKSELAKCFVEVSKYNEKITENAPEWEEYNKYEWTKQSEKSFKAAEEGTYLILADFWEKELPMQRAAAYHVVFVGTKADTIEGESKVLAWIKNNVVSVVLFGVAAVMLILIIILLLVKPSDETLEDVDKEVVKKKDKKKDDKKDEE